MATAVTPVSGYQTSGTNGSSTTGRRQIGYTPHDRRFTPYRKSPRLHRLAHGIGQIRQSQRTRSERESISLKGVIGKTWRLYKVSPLYNFSYHTSSLRKYSRQLGSFIEAELKKGEAVASEDTPDTAHISVFKGLKVTRGDKEAVHITLKTRPKKDGSTSPVLEALLVCTNLDENIKVDSTFTALPLLMVKGPAMLGQLLSVWLQTEYDCSISPMTLPGMSLSWFIALWAGSVPEGKTKPVELGYSVPSEVEGLSRITMTVNPHDCKDLWDSIHLGGEELSADEAIAFIRSLELHFFHHFRVHINAMQLSRIGTAVAYLASEGKLKIFSEEHVLQILAHLTELAAESVLVL